MLVRLGLLRMLLREGTSVVVWRGMTGVRRNELRKLIGSDPKEFGSASIDQSVPLSQMGWWSEKQGFALIYATTDPVVDQLRAGYDVLMKGIVENDGSNGAVTHALRKDMATRIRITDVFYAWHDPKLATNRKAALLNIAQRAAGNGIGVVPRSTTLP